MLARAQMTIRDEADVVIRSTAPASPVTDMLWLDTSSTPHQLKRWNGSAWVECGANVDLSAYYTKTEMDTKIEQTNSAIALKADSSTVSSLGDRLAQAEQKITPEGIAVSVTSAAYYAYEKYMMYQKVLLFRQYDLAEKILASNNPSEIKRLGRTRFPEFNSDVWDRTSYAIVKRGVRAKFEQNKDILQVLLDTQDNVLAECSLMDKKWGIGVAIDNPDCSDPSKWNGKNYLGRILMEVRDELRRLSAAGRIGYVDAKDRQFPLWNSFAGVLRCNPKIYPVINAYCDTLPRRDIQSCFLYDYSLYQWEIAMHTNMGGGLPAIGFWEMKQDIYETLRV